MRVFIAVLVLIFNLQSLSKAEDIRDFEIEGMSIGDNALDHFTENELISKINSYEDKGYIYASRDFYSLTFQSDPKFEQYDAVQINFKDNDKEYKIYSLSGVKYHQSDINDCYEQMKIIKKEFDVLFNNTNKEQYTKRKHVYDKMGKSTTTDAYYFFANRDFAAIHCFDWFQSKDINIPDQLNVVLNTNEFGFFLNNKAYK